MIALKHVKARNRISFGPFEEAGDLDFMLTLYYDPQSWKSLANANDMNPFNEDCLIRTSQEVGLLNKIV